MIRNEVLSGGLIIKTKTYFKLCYGSGVTLLRPALKSKFSAFLSERKNMLRLNCFCCVECSLGSSVFKKCYSTQPS